MKAAILHYSVPPVVGGVEAVIVAHANQLLKAGFSVTLVAGVGDRSSLPAKTELKLIPGMDSRDPDIVRASQQLEGGEIPGVFEALTANLERQLEPILQSMDNVIVHNVLTKHFNLPLTAALVQLLDRGKIRNCIAWCHDFTWTSPHSQSSVHPGYPWDMLRTYREDVRYVTVSQFRQRELADLFGCPLERIQVIYDGVDPTDLYSLSQDGESMIEHLGLGSADLILLMPVRITQAKNIEFALQMLSILKSRGIAPKLIITGPPDPHDPENLKYYQSLLQMRQQLNLVDEVRFVYETGPQPEKGYTIGLPLVRELYRVADMLFMPSHREGFGMPILEAGLIGMPIASTEIPAVEEIGGQEVLRYAHDAPADEVAEMILKCSQTDPVHLLRRRIRQNFTWEAIFENNILPLLVKRGAP